MKAIMGNENGIVESRDVGFYWIRFIDDESQNLYSRSFLAKLHKDVDPKDTICGREIDAVFVGGQYIINKIIKQDSWQDVVNQLFGGKDPEPEPLPTYELTERERDFLKRQAACWVDPMKFTVYENAVIMYVTTHRSGFDYATCLGIYEDPLPVLNAVLNSEEYQRYLGFNAKMPSVQPLVNAAIRAGSYTLPQSDYITSQCKKAIEYYHKTKGTNLE